MSWDTPIILQAVSANGGVDLTTGYCLPAHVRIQGLASGFTTAAAQKAPGPSEPTSTAPQNYVPAKLNTDALFFGLLGAQPKGIIEQPPQGAPEAQIPGIVVSTHQQQTNAGASNACNTLPISASTASKPVPMPITEATEFFISQTDLDNAALRTGWDFGTLAVPFKIQLSKSHAFTGSGTVGGYLGYRMPFGDMALKLTPVIFGGASNISTSATTGGTTTSQTVAGLSYGFGIIGKIKDSFQIGLVVGADHVDSAQPYKYNDKPWISFGLGYSFSQ